MSGGGPKKPPMPATETNFDLVVVGGFNAAALMKYIQADDVGYKMAIIADKSKYVLPENYFPITHEHVAPLKLESATVSA
jgi:hypothetical protein